MNSARGTMASMSLEKLARVNLLYDNFSEMSTYSNSDYETCSEGLSPHQRSMSIQRNQSEKEFDNWELLHKQSQVRFTSSLPECLRIKKPLDPNYICSAQSDSNIIDKSEFIATYMSNLLNQKWFDGTESETSFLSQYTNDNLKFHSHSSLSLIKDVDESVSCEEINSPILANISNTLIPSNDTEVVVEREEHHEIKSPIPVNFSNTLIQSNDTEVLLEREETHGINTSRQLEIVNVFKNIDEPPSLKSTTELQERVNNVSLYTTVRDVERNMNEGMIPREQVVNQLLQTCTENNQTVRSSSSQDFENDESLLLNIYPKVEDKEKNQETFHTTAVKIRSEEQLFNDNSKSESTGKRTENSQKNGENVTTEGTSFHSFASERISYSAQPIGKQKISREHVLNAAIESLLPQYLSKDTLSLLSDVSCFEKSTGKKDSFQEHRLNTATTQTFSRNSLKDPGSPLNQIPWFNAVLESGENLDEKFINDEEKYMIKPIPPQVPLLDLDSFRKNDGVPIFLREPRLSDMASSDAFPLRSRTSLWSTTHKDSSISTLDIKLPKNNKSGQSFNHSRNFAPILRIEDELRPFQTKLCELHGKIRALNLDLNMRCGLRSNQFAHASGRPEMLEGVKQWLIQLPQNIFMCNYHPHASRNETEQPNKQVVNIIDKKLPCPIHIKSAIVPGNQSHAVQNDNSKLFCNKCNHCIKCHKMINDPPHHKSTNLSQKSSEKSIKHHCKHHCKRAKKKTSKQSVDEQNQTNRNQNNKLVKDTQQDTSNRKSLNSPVAEECRKYMFLNDSNKEIHSIQDFINSGTKSYGERIVNHNEDNDLNQSSYESKETLMKTSSSEDTNSKANYQSSLHILKNDTVENTSSYIELFKLAKNYAFISKDMPSIASSSNLKESDLEMSVTMHNCKYYFETMHPLGTSKHILSVKQDALGIRCRPEDFL